MSKRWSKLQRELYLIRADNLDMQIHCRVYRMSSKSGGTNAPRYWITVNKEIIWDYPKQFSCNPKCEFTGVYPYVTDVSLISALIREYIDTPISEIMEKNFENDRWNLINILRASDKRMGKRRLIKLKDQCKCTAVDKILSARKVRT